MLHSWWWAGGRVVLVVVGVLLPAFRAFGNSKLQCSVIDSGGMVKDREIFSPL